MFAALAFAHDVMPIWLAVMWLASIRWTQRDAEARVRNRRAIRAAVVAAAVLPFLGAAVWACARPAETLTERRRRRLGRLLLELEAGVDLSEADTAEPMRAQPSSDASPLRSREPASELAA